MQLSSLVFIEKQQHVGLVRKDICQLRSAISINPKGVFIHFIQKWTQFVIPRDYCDQHRSGGAQRKTHMINLSAKVDTSRRKRKKKWTSFYLASIKTIYISLVIKKKEQLSELVIFIFFQAKLDLISRCL